MQRSKILALIGIPILTLIAYHAILWNQFVLWDDDLLITNNPIVTGGLTFANIIAAFTHYDPQLYIPLTFLSYQLNVLIAGVEPWIFLLSNLLLHIASALLVWKVMESLFKNRIAAIITAVLFAVHPLHVETVAWASARKDVLSGFFFLLTLFLYLHEKKKWSIVAFALGLLSKVSIVVVPGILLLMDWMRDERMTRNQVIQKIPYVALSVIAVIIAFFGKASAGLFLGTKMLMAAKASIFYLQKLLLPFGLSTVYPYTKTVSLLTPDLLVSVLLVIVISIAVWRLRHIRVLPFAWIWYLLLLLPSFATVAKGYNQAFDLYFASDRYAYLASIGPLLLVGMGCEFLMRRYRLATAAVLSCIVAVLCFLTFRQTLVWHDSESLFSNAIAEYPDAHVAHTNQGTLLYEDGDTEGAKREFEAALAIRPDARAFSNLAAIAYENGDDELAISFFRKALEAAPGDLDAHINLGGLLLNRQSFAEALPVLQDAVSIDEKSKDALVNLALAYEGLGKITEAITVLQKAQALFPEDLSIRATIQSLEQKQ